MSPYNHNYIIIHNHGDGVVNFDPSSIPGGPPPAPPAAAAVAATPPEGSRVKLATALAGLVMAVLQLLEKSPLM